MPDGTEQELEDQKRPKWPHMNLKKGNCPFSLIYKKWVVHPDDISKHPSYIESSAIKSENETDRIIKQETAKKNNEALSQSEGVGVYYLAKFRGIHNHPLDLNLLNERNTTDVLKKRVVGRAI